MSRRNRVLDLDRRICAGGRGESDQPARWRSRGFLRAAPAGSGDSNNARKRGLVFSLALHQPEATPEAHDICHTLAMATSQKVVADALRNAVRRMLKGPERDDLTVNGVRSHVEIELGLEPGYLKKGSWKQESKSIVKSESVRFMSHF